MARLLIVANRLPITVRTADGGVEVQRSTGGLATGLAAPHEQSGGLWIGWSGAPESLPPEQRARLDEQLAAMRLVQVPLHVSDWDSYVEVNEVFAEVVAGQYQPGDLIWVHDYQLLLLPGLLRRRLPEARIGFFLHIPFPSEELFRTLPARDKL